MKEGPYSEYLKRAWDFSSLEKERKKHLKKIAEMRNRDILVYAADFNKNIKGISNAIDYSDILPFSDQLEHLSGKGEGLDVIVETPGGLAEVAEDMIRMIRDKYQRVGMIVPGWAKSAGTIFVMAGDEILMGNTSALGPIDPQINFYGKRFSADAIVDDLERIKKEVAETQKLSPAYVPILQNISPGEIQHCLNAREFSQKLVKEWLEKFKFKYWEKHSSSGKKVTDDEKKKRAAEIAEALCDHSKWLTHNRSIRIEDLKELRLVITDYTESSKLNEEITRYYTLLRMSFDMTNIYKIFETPHSQIVRLAVNKTPSPKSPSPSSQEGGAEIRFKCSQCGKETAIQVNVGKHRELKKGMAPYPFETNIFKCPNCGFQSDISPIKMQIEAEFGRKVVP